jgi:hypothetical protein
VDQTELDALREKVAQEPEGSPARLLLAELDRLKAEASRASETYFLHELQTRHFLTPEEAKKVSESVTQGTPSEFERGRCRACDGTGRKQSSGCFGPRLGERCPKCRGHGFAMQIKIPT